MLGSISLLIFSNIFMTFAWYGHLKNHQDSPLFKIIIISWLIAFVEYCFQVPGNRLGIKYFTLPQLKIIQEIITVVVFSFFSIWYMKTPITKNFFYAFLCICLASYFVLKETYKG